jgi:hypothetical protein
MFVEQLEQRKLLAGDVIDYGDLTYGSPPDSYKLPNVSDELTRTAYEFDQWAASDSTHPFGSFDPLIHISDGRVAIEALTTGSLDALIQELKGLGADINAAALPGVSAWLPLTQIEAMGGLADLLFARPPLADGIAFGSGDNNSSDTSSPVDSQATDVGNETATQEVVDLGVVPELAAPPAPASYKSPRVSDLLSQVAFEYDDYVAAGARAAFVPADLQPSDVQANIQIQITDLSGNPISSIKVGQQFEIRALLLLSAPAGVQAVSGYADMLFPVTLVTPAANSNEIGLVGSSISSGVLDEAGRVMYGDSSGLVFVKTFTATKKGTATFASNQADDFGHEISVTGLDAALPWSQVTFGSATLTIKP